MKIAVISILLAFMEAGCAQIIAAQRRADEEHCLQEGFRPGTDSFVLCRLTIEQYRAKRQAKQAEEARQSDEARRRDEERRRKDDEDRRRSEEDLKRLLCLGSIKSLSCP